MGVPFAIRTIDHVVLRVRDVARMRKFYCEVLGCTLEREQPKIGLTQLRAGAALIDLVDIVRRAGGVAPPDPAAPNMDHLCLRVAPFDAGAIRGHLTAHGVAPGEVVNRFGAEGEGPSLYLSDPEGNVVELKAAAG
jgi:catechol 2,3-dioxygenase-like lactoylglutathione lyase family enzyme